MPCDPVGSTPTSRIKSINSNYVLNGTYSSTLELFYDDCLTDLSVASLFGTGGGGCIELAHPMSASLPTSVDYFSSDGTAISPDVEACFDESPEWVSGLLLSLSNDNFLAKFNVVSYFEWLRTKSIETQTFNEVGVRTALNTALTFYSQVNLGLVDISSAVDNPIKGPIRGADTMAELQQLAAAGFSNLFIQVGGNLTIERWKDHESPIELVIPEDFIHDAFPVLFSNPNTTVIRVTGASVSSLNCGDQVLSSSNGNPGPVRVCTVSGIPIPSLNYQFTNVSGEREDILSSRLNSAEITDNLLGDQTARNNVEKGQFDQEVGKIDETYIDSEGFSFDYSLFGPLRSVNDEISYGSVSDQNYGGGYAGNTEWFNLLPKIIAKNFPIPYSAFGLGAFGSQTFLKPLLSRENTPETTLQQTSAVAFRTTTPPNGISDESISNKYAYKPEILFRIATRRLQESIMSQNTYNVIMEYLPCIKLNQVVELTIPATENCPKKVIKAIVGGISMNYNVGDKKIDHGMRVTVMDTTCLGNTEMCSGNLIESNCAGEGSLDFNPWQVSQLGIDSQAQQISNTMTLFAAGDQAVGFANYTHTCATNDEYTLSFDYRRLQGNGNATISGSFTGLLTDDVGSYSSVISNGSDTININFETNGIQGPNYFQIFNIQLKKKVIV